MELTNQQETMVNDLLSERAELKEKLIWNINKASKIRGMMRKEKNSKNYWLMFDSVKKGEQGISEQRKAMNLLSIQKISSRANVNYTTVKRHEAALSGERDVRESLGI